MYSDTKQPYFRGHCMRQQCTKKVGREEVTLTATFGILQRFSQYGGPSVVKSSLLSSLYIYFFMARMAFVSVRKAAKSLLLPFFPFFPITFSLSDLLLPNPYLAPTLIIPRTQRCVPCFTCHCCFLLMLLLLLSSFLLGLCSSRREREMKKEKRRRKTVLVRRRGSVVVAVAVVVVAVVSVQGRPQARPHKG